MTNRQDSASFAAQAGGRAFSASMALASTLSLTTNAAWSNGFAGQAMTTLPTHATLPTSLPSANASAATWQTNHSLQAMPHQNASLTQNFGFNASHLSGATSAGSIFKSLTQTKHQIFTSGQTSNKNDLNLTSTLQNFLAGSIAGFREITIQVGGVKEVVSLNSHLTAAEVVAAEQVLNGGTQTLQLNAHGAASGGTIVLNGSLLSVLDANAGGPINSLTIAHGVRVIDSLSLLTLSGNLTNYGSILTAGTSSGGTDVISAGSIINASGGVVGSYTGQASTGLYAADPSLNAATITNNGSISSAGNLTLTANTIYNVAAHGPAATITAANNVLVNTQSLNNDGSIVAQRGNIDINSSGALMLSGKGNFDAAQANINLNSSNANLTVQGGNFNSAELNLDSGSGDVTAQFGTVSGTVNATANNIHMVADSKVLNLGAIDAASDPLIANQGDINLTDSSTITANGQNLTLVASGNITSSGAITFDTSSTTGSGGNVTLVAGADFTGTAATGVTVVNSSTDGHGSAGGGYINLSTTNNTLINTSSTSTTSGSSAGYVQLVAFAGSESGSGVITAQPANTSTALTLINATSIASAGKNGIVDIFAGSTATGAAVNTTGSIAGAAVTISNATPSAFSNGAVFSSNGTATSTDKSFTASAATNKGDLDVFGNIVATGDVNINTSGAFTNGGFGIQAIGPGTAPGALDGVIGHNITINTGTDITVGNLSSYGGGGSGSGSATPGSSGGAGGNGGLVNLISENGSIFALGIINVSGGGGGGGAGGSETHNATAGGAGGTAGTVSLSAQNGNVSVSQQILAFDGGAGGAGGSQANGVGGGGGGGSAVGGGGGGGGGGLGNQAADFAGGGGGGLGGLTYSNNALVGSAAGGGGGASAGSGIASTGGGGGSLLGSPYIPFGGSGNVNGNFGSYNDAMASAVGGTGAGSTNPPVGTAAGATDFSSGGQGGMTATGLGTGSIGGSIPTTTGHGSVVIQVGGIASGKAGDVTVPITIEAGNLTITSTATTSSANVLSTSGTALTVVQASLGRTGSLTIATADNADLSLPALHNGTINLQNSASAGTVTLDTTAPSVASSINIAINGSVFGNTATLNSGGAITSLSSNSITSTTAILSASQGISVTTGVTNLAASGGPISIVQDNTPINLTNIVSNGAFNLSAAGQINVTGPVTANLSTVSLTTTSSSSGISLGGAINAFIIDLTADTGTANTITQTSASSLTANQLNIVTSGSIGTTAAPLRTAANNITTNVGATGNVNVTNTSGSSLNYDGGNVASSGSLLLNSDGAQLNIVQASFKNVSITDTRTANAVVTLNSASKATPIGGDGTFTVVSSGSIGETSGSPAIGGTSVTLSATTGAIGSAAQPIAVSAPVLKVTAAGSLGSIYISAGPLTSLTATTGTAANDLFSLSSTGSLILNGTSVIKTPNLALQAVGEIDIDSAISGNNIVILSTAGAVNINKAITGTGTGSIVDITGFNNNGTAVAINSTVNAAGVAIVGKGTVAGVELNTKLGGTGAVQIDINTTGDITGSKTNALGFTTIDLTSTGGSLGSATQAINTTGVNLSSNVSGNSYISQTGNVIVGSSSAQTYSLIAAGGIDIASGLSANNIILTTTGSAKNIIIDANTGSSATSLATLTATGVLKVDSSGTISGATLILNAPSVDNEGTVTAGVAGNGSLTIQNIAGNLALTGTTGTFKNGPFSSLFLNAKGTITVGAATSSVNPLAGLTNLDSFTVSAGGIFTSPYTAISVTPDVTGQGGKVSITASNIAYASATAQTGPLLLTANSNNAAGAAGGTIVLNLPGSASKGIILGAAAGDYDISVTGQNRAGNVTITTPGALSAASADLNVSTSAPSIIGSSIILNGAKGVLLSGNFDTRSGGVGVDLTITSGSTKAFTLDGSITGNTNGQTGITTGQGIFVNSLVINNALGVVNNAVIQTNGFNITSSGNTGLSTGASGSYGTTPEGSFTISSTTGGVTLSGAQPTAEIVVISAVKGALTLGSGITTIGSINASGAGGSVTIAAKTLTMSGPSLSLLAAGSGNGAGGSVSLLLSGTSNLTIGSGAIQINASGAGSGANGNVTVATAGNLIVNTSGLNLGAKVNTGNLSLSGKLLHIDNLTALSTVKLASLALTSNSASFTLGGAAATANGISDTNQLVIADQITITNSGGAIIMGSSLGLEALSSASQALTLSAKGDIGTTVAPILVNANTTSGLSVTSSGGNAFISVSNGDEAVSANVSKTLQIVSTGNLNSGGSVLAKALNLQAAAINFGIVTTNATAITAQATVGGISIVDSQTALLTLSPISADGAIQISSAGAITNAATVNSTANSVTLESGGTITNKAAITAAQNITLVEGGATGAISIGAPITAVDSVTLTTAGKGNITEAKTGIVVTGKSVFLATGTGNIGASHTAPLVVAATIVEANGGGTTSSVFLSDTTSGAAITPSAAGKIFDYTGAFATAGQITAPSVIINSNNMAGTLTTNATTLQIAASAGSINVSDSQTALIKVNALSAPTGSIALTSQGAITTAAALSSKSGVTIASGTNGNITLGGAVTTTTGSVTVTALGTGTVINGAGTYKITAPQISLNTAGANIGSATALRTSGPSLAITTGSTGAVTLINTNASSAGIDVLSNSTVGSLIFTDTNSNAKNTGALNIGSISAGTGAITIASNEMTVNLAASQTLQTTNGNIVLQNTYVANGANLPYIGIGSDATIHASAPVGSTNLAAGNVFIALGTVPTSKTSVAGVTPTTPFMPTVFTSGFNGAVNFGTTSNTAGSITVSGAGVHLNGEDRIVAFSTGKLAATQIELSNGVTITADPPTTGSSAPAVASASILNANPASGQQMAAVSNNQAVSTNQIVPTGHQSTSSPSAPNLSSQMLNSPSNLTDSFYAASGDNAAESAANSACVAQTTRSLLGAATINARGKLTSNSPLTQNFDSGVLLLSPQHDTVVTTPHGEIALAAGAVVLMVSSKDTLAVYDLHDRHKGAVTIAITTANAAAAGVDPAETVSLSPGRSVVITTSTKKSFAEINPTSFVAYRHLSERVTPSKRLCQADFEVMSLIRGLKPLTNIATSSNPHTKKSMDSMLKTAAILSALGQGTEQFALYLPQAISAFAAQQ